MIHIAYGDSAAECLQESLADHNLEGSRVLVSRDDFTQGPISECDDQMATRQRPNYWQRVHSDVHIDLDVHTLYTDTLTSLSNLESDQVIVWQGHSCHDILATSWLLTYYRSRNIKWWIVDLGQLSPADINANRPPINLAMFRPDQLPALSKYKQTIPAEGIDAYLQLWEQMRNQNGAYRILDGDEIRSVNEDYHDAYIMSRVPEKWTNASDFIGDTLRHGSGSISDLTIQWRLRYLMESDHLLAQGDRSDIHNLEIRRSRV